MSKRLGIVLATFFIPALQGCASISILQPTGSSSAATAPVSVPVQIEITKSVYARSFALTKGTNTLPIPAFATSIKPGTQNTEILTTTLQLPAGSYALKVAGTFDEWTGQATPISQTSAFTVSLTTPAPVITLVMTPVGDILAPRGGASAPLTFAITRANATSKVDVTASNLPSGASLGAVSMAIGTATSASPTASVSATAKANGERVATFTAKATGAPDVAVTRNVKVVPTPGAFTWVAAPFLTVGPPPATSPDGLFRMTASRVGLSRVWTLHISPTTGTGPTLDVTTASWGGAGGSSLAGIAFCPSSPTLSALVLSDEDESDPPTTHAPGVTYSLKVISFVSGAPVELGSLQGLKYLNAVQPRLGFSKDCSIVGSWSVDYLLPTTRNVQFHDIFNHLTGGAWSYTDPVSGAASAPSPSLATIGGAIITLTGPTGQTATRPVP